VSLFRFLADYLPTLLNVWFGIASAVLVVNDVIGSFAGWSWEWPRRHRFKAAVAVLIVAQIGAYKALKAENDALRTQAGSTVSAGGTALSALREDANALRAEVETRDRRIFDLQTALAQRSPVIVPAPAVNVFAGSNGQAQAFALSTDNPSLFWPTLKDWTRTKSALEIPIDWSAMAGLDAYADFTMYTGTHTICWGQARIFDMSAGSSAVETPQLTTGNDGKDFHLLLPRQTGIHRYILQMRTEQKDGADMNVLGRIMVVKQ